MFLCRYMGVSENVVYPIVASLVLLIIIPMKNGYFIWNINPTFSDTPMWWYVQHCRILSLYTQTWGYTSNKVRTIYCIIHIYMHKHNTVYMYQIHILYAVHMYTYIVHTLYTYIYIHTFDYIYINTSMAQCLVAPPFRRRTGERRLAAKGSSQDAVAGGCTKLDDEVLAPLYGCVWKWS